MTTEAPTDRELRELAHQVERDARAEKVRAQREHGVAFMRWDLATRDLVERCAFCGMSAASHAGTVRVLAMDWSGAEATGHLSVGFCASCGNLYRTYAGGRNAEAVTLSESLKRADMAEYYPSPASDDASSIRANNRRARHGLTWAGAAHRARIGGLEDPGSPDVGYSHLSGIKADVVDFSPSQPEPSMPRRLADA